MKAVLHNDRRSSRRGTVLMVALVALVVVMAVTAGLLQRAALLHRKAIYQEWALQADWLAESGLARAVSRLAAEPEYRDEEWKPTPEEMSSEYAGRVTVRVTVDDQDPAKKKVTVTADYPDRDHERARSTRVLVL